MSLKLYIEPYGANTCTRDIIKYIPHEEASIEDCDYIVSSKVPPGCIIPHIIQQALHSYIGVNKKVIVFLLSDYNEPFDIPSNVLFYRSGIYKSQKKPNEYLIPHVWTEEGMEGIEFRPFLTRVSQPIVGFCGTLSSHHSRIQHVNKLNITPDIKKKFILRSDYWAGKPNDKQVIDDFIKNIQETCFTLCSRGAGNWSARFYQVLYLGRIPIVVDSDLVLPFEDKINWRDVIVFCDSENDLPKNIKNFWKTKDMVQAQRHCKYIYDTYLSPQSWCRLLAEELLSKAKNNI